MKYIIIPSVILSIIAILSLDPKLWITSDVHHFYFEIMAVVLSTVVAVYCITRSYSLNEKFSLFIGIGFLTIANSRFFARNTFFQHCRKLYFS